MALRSLLSRSRILILVDDVYSEDSLMEILRMDGPFALVCTSRAKLSGLTGLITFIELGQLPARDGAELVKAVSGPERLTDEQVAALVEACAGHPLALHVAAAYLARRPKAVIDPFLTDITNPERGVRALRAGQTALEPVLESSFAALDAEQADLFMTLGMLPYMSVTTDIVTAMTVGPDELDETRIQSVFDLLDSLFELSLIEQVEQDRFVLHEILHRFARLKSASATPQRREEVIQRASQMMAARANSATRSIGFVDKEASIPAQSNEEALRQLNADRPGCIALAEEASHHGLWGPVALIAATATPSLRLGGHWREIERLFRCLLQAGSATENSEWTATALHNLGLTAAHLGATKEASSLLVRSAETARGAKDPFHYFMARLSLGTFLINLGRGSEAIPHIRCGLRFWRSINDREMLSHALENLGQANLIAGRLDRAERYLRDSRRLREAADHPSLHGHQTLAVVLRRSGRLAEAAQVILGDLARARAIGDRAGEAIALMELANIPEQERPAGVPAQLLEAALVVYRGMGDVHGEIRALLRLGQQATERAELQQAVEHFADCARLATDIGEHQTAAQAAASLGTLHGGIGQVEEAEVCFADARAMASLTDNRLVEAHVLRERAQFLRHQGKYREAVTALTEAVGLLQGTEDKGALYSARAALGEALVVSGRWQAGARELEPIATLPEGEVSSGTKSQALRSLSVLYSRRGLHREAESAATRALEQVQRAGDRRAVLTCRMALANVHARNHDDAQALDQYEKAAEAAAELSDVQVLLTARAMAAVSRLKNGEEERAATAMTALLPLAEQLGMQALKATLHANLGIHYLCSDANELALTELRAALTIAESLGDHALRATCLLNLARSYRGLNQNEASRDHARQAFDLYQQLGDWSDTAAALLLLLKLYIHENPESNPHLRRIGELLGDDKPINKRTLEAWNSLISSLHSSDPEATPIIEQPVSTNGRTISVSAEVRRGLAGIDVQKMIGRLSNSRQSCLACNLAIDEQGRAELILLLHPAAEHLIVRLEHPHCGKSRVIQLKGRAPSDPEINMETECIIFGGDTAGIIIDCYGGWGFTEDGNLHDLVLDRFRQDGFMDLQAALGKGSHSAGLAELPAHAGSSVRAHLKNHVLALTDPHGEELVRMPLDFLPRWYRKAVEGTLIVLIGRNLQGMAAEDNSYLTKAISAGNVIGAVVPLTVTRPSRNSRCPCMRRKGRKFKHCCGRKTPN